MYCERERCSQLPHEIVALSYDLQYLGHVSKRHN